MVRGRGVLGEDVRMCFTSLAVALACLTRDSGLSAVQGRERAGGTTDKHTCIHVLRTHTHIHTHTHTQTNTHNISETELERNC